MAGEPLRASRVLLVKRSTTADVVCTLTLKKHNVCWSLSAWTGVGRAGNRRKSRRKSAGKWGNFRWAEIVEIAAGRAEIAIGEAGNWADLGMCGNLLIREIASAASCLCPTGIVSSLLWSYDRTSACVNVPRPYAWVIILCRSLICCSPYAACGTASLDL